MTSIPALIMLPPIGGTFAEQWVSAGRLAAASDLVERLQAAGGFDPIMVLAADGGQRSELAALGVVPLEPADGDFHFGRTLARIIRERDLEQIAYFGGASAPLLTVPHLQQQLEKLRIAKNPKAVVNNIYSSDWFMLNRTSLIERVCERLPADNPIGYVLLKELDVEVEGMPAEAASRLDLDTPTDFALISEHAAVGKHLERFLHTLDRETADRIERIKSVLNTPASTLSIVGRCSSQVWQALETATQIWIRVFVEERGMVASRRLANGEVRSLMAEMVNETGPKEFLERIGSMSDALLWDTRVWMGAGRSWPSPGDRFASDLGLVDQIEDKPLRELTHASLQAGFPVLLGGYGVVAGGIYALLESMK
jgi:hypothetical protein